MSNVVFDLRSSGYIVAFAEAPPLGTKMRFTNTAIVELIEIGSYEKKDGSEGVVLFWQYDDGSTCTTGLRSKGWSKDSTRERLPQNRQRVRKKARFAILSRDGFRCVCCGKGPDEERLEVDHIVPVSLGGTNDPQNLQTLCCSCNQGKSNKITSEAARLMF